MCEWDSRRVVHGIWRWWWWQKSVAVFIFLVSLCTNSIWWSIYKAKQNNVMCCWALGLHLRRLWEYFGQSVCWISSWLWSGIVICSAVMVSVEYIYRMRIIWWSSARTMNADCVHFVYCKVDNIFGVFNSFRGVVLWIILNCRNWMFFWIYDF